MNKKIGVLLLALMFLTTLASAEIFIAKQPADTYSLGDTMNIVLGSDGTPGWAKMDLICENKTKMLYYHYLTSEDTRISISTPLTKDFLRGLSGDCHLLLTTGNKTKKSMDFTIYNQINIDIKFNALSFAPNSTMTFSGTASKPSTQEVNGFIEISVEDTELEAIIPVIKNRFSGEFDIPESLAAGKYLVDMFIYEKLNSEEITNFGNQNTTIIITQQPAFLEIQTSETISPDNSLEFTGVLKDHTGQTINAVPVSFKLVTIEGEEVLNILSETDKKNYFKIQKSAPYGYWNLNAKSKDITAETQVYITENEEASFDIINGTLLITNIGNVPYDNPVEIAIAEHKKVIEINLTLGESTQFDLEAPDGDYEVSVKDGSNSLTGTFSLTGNAIVIKGDGERFGFVNKGVLAWTFLVLILGLFVFISSKRVMKGKAILPVKNYSKPKTGGVLKINPSKPNKLEKHSTEAKHSLVIDGTKQASAVLALKIKNHNEIQNAEMDISDHLKKISRIITESDGRIYKSGEYLLGIFAPATTRTFDNTIIALKSAKKIQEDLSQFNNTAKLKINFGLSVGSGDIIARKHEGALSFNAVGNLLINSKKIAEISENNLLISEDANKALASKARTTANEEKFGIKSYSLKSITSQSDNQKFINSFMKRNEFKKLDKFRV